MLLLVATIIFDAQYSDTACQHLYKINAANKEHIRMAALVSAYDLLMKTGAITVWGPRIVTFFCTAAHTTYLCC